MHRTTVMLPAELKNRALERARESGISLGELIRRSLESALESDAARSSDPLFADPGIFRGPAPSDLAERHDDYLYGGLGDES